MCLIDSSEGATVRTRGLLINEDVLSDGEWIARRLAFDTSAAPEHGDCLVNNSAVLTSANSPVHTLVTQPAVMFTGRIDYCTEIHILVITVAYRHSPETASKMMRV